MTDGLKGMGEAPAGGCRPASSICCAGASISPIGRSGSRWRRPSERSTCAPTEEAAGAAVDTFERGPWGAEIPDRRRSVATRLDPRDPFFAFAPEVRKVIYTTNALESVHAQLRKIIKTRGHFPNDEAATKLTWLALRNIIAKWARGAIHWRAAMNQFAILYEGRFTKPAV